MTDQPLDLNALAAALGAAVSDAEAAQIRAQYGKLTIKPRYIKWVEKEPIEVAGAEYIKLGARERSLELVFAIDIQEFNPTLEFTYERKVMIGGADWWRIFKPSVETVLGKGALSKDKLNDTLAKIHGQYVQVHDVLQAATKKRPDPEFRTMQLVQIYATREECFAAWQAAYASGAAAPALEAAAAGDIPSGWEPDAWGAVKEDFDTALAEIKAKPAGVQKKLIAKLAEDYAIPVDFINAALSK